MSGVVGHALSTVRVGLGEISDPNSSRVSEGNLDFQRISLSPFDRRRQQAERGAVACLTPHGQEVPCVLSLLCP